MRLKSFLMVMVISLFFIGCGGPDINKTHEQTLEFVGKIASVNEQAQLLKIHAKKITGKKAPVLVTPTPQPEKYFEKEKEWEVLFNAFKKWFNICQINSPEVTYYIKVFIINGTNAIGDAGFEGGDMPIANQPRKE